MKVSRDQIVKLAEAPTAWITRVKYRALGWVLAILLATVATITLAGAPWVPVVGFAMAAAWVSVSKLTTRLLQPTCMTCGKDLSGEPIGVHGIACPSCGSIQSPTLVDLAKIGKPEESDEA